MEILDVPITFLFCHTITFENCTVTLNLDWEPINQCYERQCNEICGTILKIWVVAEGWMMCGWRMYMMCTAYGHYFSTLSLQFQKQNNPRKLCVIDAHGCVTAITSAEELNTYEIYPRITLIPLISKTLAKPPQWKWEKMGVLRSK